MVFVCKGTLDHFMYILQIRAKVIANIGRKSAKELVAMLTPEGKASCSYVCLVYFLCLF